MFPSEVETVLMFPTNVEISFFLPKQRKTYKQQTFVCSYQSGDRHMTIQSPCSSYLNGDSPHVSYHVEIFFFLPVEKSTYYIQSCFLPK